MSSESGHSKTGVCRRCGREVPVERLRHASLPPAEAIAAVGISDVDEFGPLAPATFLDRRRYCPACRWRVNLQRMVWLVFSTALLATLLYFALR